MHVLLSVKEDKSISVSPVTFEEDETETPYLMRNIRHILGLLSGAVEKHLSGLWEIMHSNPNDAASIHPWTGV